MLKMRENAASRAGRENPSCGKGRAPSAPRPVEGPGLITAQLIKRWSGRCLGPDGAIHPDGSHPPSVAPSPSRPPPPLELKGNMSPQRGTLFDPCWPQSGISDPVYKEGCEVSPELCGLEPVEDKEGSPLNTSWPS